MPTVSIARPTLAAGANAQIQPDNGKTHDENALALFRKMQERHATLTDDKKDAFLEYLKLLQEGFITNLNLQVFLTDASSPLTVADKIRGRKTYDLSDMLYQGFMTFHEKDVKKTDQAKLEFNTGNGKIHASFDKIEYLPNDNKFTLDDAYQMVLIAMLDQKMLPPNAMHIDGSVEERILIERAVDDINAFLQPSQHILLDKRVSALSKLRHIRTARAKGDDSYILSHLHEVPTDAVLKQNRIQRQNDQKAAAAGGQVFQQQVKDLPAASNLQESLTPEGAIAAAQLDEDGMTKENAELEGVLTKIQGPAPDPVVVYKEAREHELNQVLDTYGEADVVGYTTDAAPVYLASLAATPESSQTNFYFIKDDSQKNGLTVTNDRAKILQITLDGKHIYYKDENVPFRTHKQDLEDEAIKTNTQESLALVQKIIEEGAHEERLEAAQTSALQKDTATVAAPAQPIAAMSVNDIARQYVIYHQEAFKGQSVAKLGEIVNKLYKRDNLTAQPLEIDSAAVAKMLTDEGLITTREAKSGKTTKTVISKVVNFQFKDEVHNTIAKGFVENPQIWVGKTVADVEAHVKQAARNRFDAAAQTASSWKSLANEGVIILDGKGKNAKIKTIATGLSNVPQLTSLFTKAAAPVIPATPEPANVVDLRTTSAAATVTPTEEGSALLSKALAGATMPLQSVAVSQQDFHHVEAWEEPALRAAQ